MAIITLPSGILEIEWTAPPRAAWKSKSGWSGKGTTIDRGTVTEGWRASVTVAPRNASDAMAWIGWQAAMLGPVNAVELVAVRNVPFAGPALVNIASSPSINAVTFDGLTPNLVNFIKVGQLVTIYTGSGPDKPRMVVATSSVSTNGAGVSGVMTFQPPLTGVVAGRKAVINRPFCQMSLAAQVSLGWKMSANAIYQPVAFELEEVMA